MLAAAGTRPKFDCSHDGWLQKAGERHNTILLQQCSFLATMPNTAGKGTHRLTSARGFGQKDAAGFRVCGLHPSNTHCTIGHAPSWYRHVLPVFRQDGVAWDDAPRPRGNQNTPAEVGSRHGLANLAAHLAGPCGPLRVACQTALCLSHPCTTWMVLKCRTQRHDRTSDTLFYDSRKNLSII